MDEDKFEMRFSAEEKTIRPELKAIKVQGFGAIMSVPKKRISGKRKKIIILFIPFIELIFGQVQTHILSANYNRFLR